MNTPVSFELAKLLNKNKCYILSNNRYNKKGTFTYSKAWSISAPTISEVVMWLYETHDIWIMVDMTGSKKFYPRGRMIDKKGKHHVGDFKYNNERLIYNSPTEAYEAAILYCLTNLI